MEGNWLPKAATLNYGEWVEMYNGADGLMVWYRNPEFGPEWPSMSHMMTGKTRGVDVMTLYLRTKNDQPRYKKYDNPLEAGHPLVDANVTCPACHQLFFAGDFVCLVVLGPGDDPEEQEKCRDDRPYNAMCTAVHTQCVTGRLT